MDSQTAFCPNPNCPASGQCGKGNLTIWSQKKRRCGKNCVIRIDTRLQIQMLRPYREFTHNLRYRPLCRPMLIAIDSWRAYLGAIQHVFREALPAPHGGHPRLRPWDGICIAQVIKQYERGHVVGILRNIVQAAAPQVEALLPWSKASI